MIDCNICKHKEDRCIGCKHGELFERKMCQNLKKYQLVTGKNIADIVVICVNTQEDIKSSIVLGVADLI
nr:MAG TPA: hypothetical protein [Caudoviricetes sp.]